MKFHTSRTKKSIRQRRVDQMIEEIEYEEEYQLNNKFHANPVPHNLHMPLYHQLQ
jgi:hypothetical protein